MKKLLQLWAQAGERPYEVLFEQGVYCDFLGYLNSSRMRLDSSIFRGTRRHQELVIGNLLDYTYPTSWSTRVEIAFNFVEEEKRPVILSFTSDQPVGWVCNPYNAYEENEIILAPTLLIVTSRIEMRDFILLQVVPSF